MIIFKLLGTGWMLIVFWCGIHWLMRAVIGDKDPFSSLLAVVFMWLLIGLGPVAVVKFAWNFIK